MRPIDVIFTIFLIPFIACGIAFLFGFYSLVVASHYADAGRMADHSRFRLLSTIASERDLSPRGVELRTRGMKSLAVAGTLYVAFWVLEGAAYLISYIQRIW